MSGCFFHLISDNRMIPYSPFLTPVIMNLSYLRRNDFLVDNATVVVAWWDGVPRGGTAYTLRRARHAGCRVINIYPDLQLDFGF